MIFNKHDKNPVLGGKALGVCFDVYVTYINQQYRMDFSWRTQKSLGVTFSNDGIHWSKPQITLGFDKTSGWEDDVNRNCVLYDEGIYKMWYTGQARGYSYIGYAESKDGIDFRRIQDKPIMIPQYPYEKYSVMNPCIIKENGVYKMWYAAGETYEPNVLCYAESKDGIHFEKSKINPMFVKGTEEYEQDRVGGCQVIKTKKYGYLMFYIGYKDIDTACICAAQSENGITNWRRCIDNPLIVPDKNMWDEDSCYKPTVIYDEKTGKMMLWYNGRRGKEEYIGLAVMENSQLNFQSSLL